MDKKSKLLQAIKSGKIKNEKDALAFVVAEKEKEKLIKEIISEIPKPVKGEKGEVGETGKPGKDGLNGRNGKDGRDGKDGKSPDINQIVSKASNMAYNELKTKIPTIPQIVQELPQNGESVRDSLELLTGKDRLKREAIDGLDNYPEVVEMAKKAKVNNYYGGAGIKELVAGTGISIDNTNLGYPVISYSGSETDPIWAIDKPNYSTTSAGDLRWLGISAKAADSDLLDGHDTAYFQTALSFGNLTEATSSVLTISGGTGAVIGSGASIQVKQASHSQSGYLSNTDWDTFNGKQTALTNPVTGTGVSGQIAYWNGTTTQTGSANLTFDGAKMTIAVGTRGTHLYLKDGDTGTGGGNFGSASATNLFFLGGAYYNSAYYAYATVASGVNFYSGYTYFYNNQGLTPGGTYTPTATITLGRDNTTTFAGSLYLPNNERIYFKDSGGTYRTVFQFNSGNATVFRGGAGGLEFQNSGGNSLLTSAGNGVWTFKDTTASTGITSFKIQAGAGQGSNDLFSVSDNAGTTSYLKVNSAGAVLVPALTAGTIPFATTGGQLANTSALYWDNANGRFGLGISNPGVRFDMSGGYFRITNGITSTLDDFITLRPDGQSGSRGDGVGIVFYGQPTNSDTLYSTGRIYGVFGSTGYGSERITIQSMVSGNWTDTLTVRNGNVGIGTTAPGTYGKVESHQAIAVAGGVANLAVVDTTSQAIGHGGAIQFVGAYNGTTLTEAGMIRAEKVNSTAGDYSFNLGFYTRNNGVGSLTRQMVILNSGFLRADTSKYRRYYHIPLTATNPGASGANWVSSGANTTGGWNLTSATHILEGQTDVHSDWDGASDPKFEARFAVNVDNTGGADTDTVDLKLVIYYKGIGDTATKTQTVEVATVIGKSARYKQFEVTFPLNYDEASNVLDVGDVIGFKLNLETDTSEVDDIILADMSFSYLTTHTYVEDGDE